MELELRGTLHAVQEELTPGCEMLARQLLCSGALPTCENGSECVSGPHVQLETLSLPPLTDKLEMCEKQCDLLDMLLVCSQDLQMALRSISYINFSVCRRNRSSLLPFSHPSCLPTPVLIPDTKGTLNEGKEERKEGRGRRYTQYISLTNLLGFILHINYPNQTYMWIYIHINYPNQTYMWIYIHINYPYMWIRFVKLSAVTLTLTGPGLIT